MMGPFNNYEQKQELNKIINIFRGYYLLFMPNYFDFMCTYQKQHPSVQGPLKRTQLSTGAQPDTSSSFLVSLSVQFKYPSTPNPEQQMMSRNASQIVQFLSRKWPKVTNLINIQSLILLLVAAPPV